MPDRPRRRRTPASTDLRMRRRTGSGSFSLVELVIVVVIISIIAAIAVPRISNASNRARETALVADLVRLRSAIDRYAAEHNGDFPATRSDGLGNAANTAAAFVNQLTMYTAANGNASATADPSYAFGPYLHRIPPLPVSSLAGADTVAIDTANSPPLVTGNGEGWVYNPNTGEIIANSDEPNAEGSRTFDGY